MNRNRYSVLLPLVPLLATSWLAMALVDMNGGDDHLIIGATIGTILGQTTLASAWTAVGPGPLLWRLPLALAWCAVLIVALAVGKQNRLTMSSRSSRHARRGNGSWCRCRCGGCPCDMACEFAILATQYHPIAVRCSLGFGN